MQVSLTLTLTRSGIPFAGSIKIMVGTLFTTPWECGKIFRNITWTSLDRKNISLQGINALAGQNIVKISSMLRNFCRLKGPASWKVIGTDANFWYSLPPEFLHSICRSMSRVLKGCFRIMFQVMEYLWQMIQRRASGRLKVMSRAV